MLLSASSFLGVAIDVVIVAIVAVFGLIGLKKGFFKSVLSMISGVVVIVACIFLAGPTARLINKIYDFNGLLGKRLCKSIAGMGTFYSQAIPAGVSGTDLINAIPASTNGFLKKLMSYVLKPLSASEVEGATVADIVSGAFASIIVTVVAGILLFILIKIIIALASRLFDNITKNRVFGATNKLMGLLFGAIKGFILVLVITITLTLLTVIPTVNTKLTPILQDHTKIAKPIYNYTDEMVEKYVVDGKIVQKWIDNLWDNKYDKGDTTPAPDGTANNPYTATITENEGVYSVTIEVTFDNANPSKYYVLDFGAITTTHFEVGVAGDNIGAKELYKGSVEDANVVADPTQMPKQENEQDIRYILELTRADENVTSATVTVTVTPKTI